MSEECNICSEKYNNSTRKLVKCYCEFEFCKLCFKKYILSKKENPICMNCNMVYTRKFLAENLDKSFMTKEYKKIREELIFDQETAMFPITQTYIEKTRAKEKLEEERARINEEIKQLTAQIQELINPGGKKLTEKREFIRQCPNNDCKGFLSSSLKCGLCENWACKNCHEMIGPNKDDPHECDQEILKNINTIKKETKPCPRCGVPIFKINGCSSMFCIECDVSFNWNTLRIESGPIHNPEYFEKLKRVGNIVPRDPNDILCGRELDHNFTYQLTAKLHFGPYKGYNCKHDYILSDHPQCCGQYRRKYLYSDKIEQISQECLELNTLGVTRLSKMRNRGNRDLRVEYLLNNISKEKFVLEVQKRDKKISMNDEIIEVYRVYRTCLTDILYRLYNDTSIIKEILKEILLLRKQINTFLCEIQKVYNASCSLLVIKEDEL